MATQKLDDIATKDMFNSEEQQLIIQALNTQIATTRRKANTEGNPDIKRIHEKQLGAFISLLAKVQQ